MLACLCLNILIESADDFKKVNVESLNLNDDEKRDKFFKQDLLQVGKLIDIAKVHSCLVHTHHVGSWTVTKCINCGCHTHAVHREKGASFVLIYSKLLNAAAVSNLQSSDLFSKIFKIIVSPDIEDDDIPFETPEDVTNDAEYAIKKIKILASDFLIRENAAVEKRIKKYTEEQYEIMSNLKDRAYKEQNSLIRVIQSTTNKSKPASTNTVSHWKPIIVDEPIPTGSWSINNDSPLLNTRYVPKRQKSSPAAPISSLDAEGLFDFEGSDVPSSSDYELDESDKEDSKEEEGVSIPRARPAKGSVAKSLPMNIPTFMSKPRNRSTEDLDDVPPQDDNLDIAASIKALAKSVHGDTVFGDLPRPRFSTQL